MNDWTCRRNCWASSQLQRMIHKYVGDGMGGVRNCGPFVDAPSYGCGNHPFKLATLLLPGPIVVAGVLVATSPRYNTPLFIVLRHGFSLNRLYQPMTFYACFLLWLIVGNWTYCTSRMVSNCHAYEHNVSTWYRMYKPYHVYLEAWSFTDSVFGYIWKLVYISPPLQITNQPVTKQEERFPQKFISSRDGPVEK